jgi:hypothetical protein
VDDLFGESGNDVLSKSFFKYLIIVSMPLTKHIVTVGSSKYSYRANDIYGELAGVTGVTKAPSPDNTTYTDSLTAENFSDGIVVRLKARGVQLNSDQTVKKSRDFTIVCVADKQKSALAALPSKNIKVGAETWDLVSARIPRRRRFS